MNNYKLYVHIAPNGKRYYGITKTSPKERWKNGKGYNNNQYFTRAIKKYGWNNIKHIILFDSLTETEAKELEQYYIQWYNTADRKYGYNISLGGESNNHSEETKQKMSESKKGINNGMYGIHRYSKDNPNSKSVICITTKRLFCTGIDGAHYYNVSNASVSSCCKGKLKSAGKYNGQKLVWRYVNYKHKKFFRVA